MIKKSEYRNDIQIIRGIAVLAVVLFHSNEKFFPNGFLGVDIFFVVSGFVVTPLLARIVMQSENHNQKIIRLKLFYKSRFFRLAPALILTLTFSVFLIFLLGSPDYHSRFANQGIFTIFLLGNIGAYGFSGDYFSPNPNPLVHFWSLSVEEQIYLFFPLILLILFTKFKYSVKKFVFIFSIITSISMISFLLPEILEPFYSEVGIRSPTQFSFYSPIDRLWQFTLGGIGYFISLGDFLRKKVNIMLINWGLVTITLLSLLGVINFDLKNDSIFISFLTFMTLIFRSFDCFSNTLKSTFKWLGDRSYSIYLIHLPILWIAKYSLATQIGSSNNRFIQISLALILILFLGTISFEKIENRYRIKPNNFSQKNKTDTIRLIACLLLPLTLLFIMKISAANKYWGLDRNIVQPVFPGNLDAYCVKETERSLPCIYQLDGNKKTVLLVGDSHASHFSEAFKIAASNSDWNLVIWTKNGCQVKFSKNARDSSLANCVNSFLELEKWVLLNKPNVVVVSQYIRSDSNINQLQSALQRLKSNVPNVLLIGNNPVFPGEDRFLEARPLIMPPAKPKKFFLNSEMDIKDEAKSNELLSWARINQIDTLDIKTLFCESTGCSRYSNGNWLYRDPSHLSISGANLIVPKISEYLAKRNS
jgi:peptidoglycan/LPS O-acetylase OafA/YrhL